MRIRKGQKLPSEIGWTSKDESLSILQLLKEGYNYGVKTGLEYSLQTRVGNQRADAVVRLECGIHVRIEAKCLSPTTYRYSFYSGDVDVDFDGINLFNWGNKYKDKPSIFYPYTLLFVDRYVSKEAFKKCYKNGMIVVTRQTLAKKIKEIKEELKSDKKMSGGGFD